MRWRRDWEEMVGKLWGRKAGAEVRREEMERKEATDRKRRRKERRSREARK
jgi:hypothetical protein